MASCQRDFFSWVFVLCVYVFFAFNSFASHHITSHSRTLYNVHLIVWIWFNSNAIYAHATVTMDIFAIVFSLYNDIELPFYHAHMHIYTPTIQNKTFKHSLKKLQWIINIIRWIWTTNKNGESFEMLLHSFFCVFCHFTYCSTEMYDKWMRSYWANYEFIWLKFDNGIKRNHCTFDSSHSNLLTNFEKASQTTN